MNDFYNQIAKKIMENLPGKHILLIFVTHSQFFKKMQKEFDGLITRASGE